MAGRTMKERTPEVTHKIMASIKGKDTEPELMLRKALWGKGIRYRKNYKKLPGKPDIVLTKQRIVVFCDGDFWHGHNWALRGLSSLDEELSGYSQYWKDKILTNIARDRRNDEMLQELGWRVIRIWESDIRKDVESCAEVVLKAMRDEPVGPDGGKIDG